MTDSKIDTLYENYQHYGSVKHLSKKVEQMKCDSTFYGALTTASILFANEAARFTLRSPLFKLKPIPLFFVLLGPTAYLKYGAHGEIKEEVRKYWRIHKTRKEFGLGGSYNPAGVYNGLVNSNQFLSKLPIEIGWEEILLGVKYDYYPEVQGLRINKKWEEYPNCWEDYDRGSLDVQTTGLERLQAFDPIEGTTQGVWYSLPHEDSDTKLNLGGPDDDGLFVDPPDPGLGPVIDMEQSEKIIFPNRITPYNTLIIGNEWELDPEEAVKSYNMPKWSKKLELPGWGKNHKIAEAFAQREKLNDLRILKAKWLINMGNEITHGIENQFKNEYARFVENAYNEKCKQNILSP
jgi:hypothetical protein